MVEGFEGVFCVSNDRDSPVPRVPRPCDLVDSLDLGGLIILQALGRDKANTLITLFNTPHTLHNHYTHTHTNNILRAHTPTLHTITKTHYARAHTHTLLNIYTHYTAHNTHTACNVCMSVHVCARNVQECVYV